MMDPNFPDLSDGAEGGEAEGKLLFCEWESAGMVVHVGSIRQAGSKKRGRDLLGTLCPEGKQDSSPLIPDDGKFRSLLLPRGPRWDQTFILPLFFLMPSAGVRV